MTEARTTTSAADFEPRVGRSLWADAVRRLARDKVAVICFAIICIYALVAVVAPFAFAGWNDSHDYDNVYTAPSRAEPFGTDKFGRSILQKTLLAASTSMSVGFFATIIAVPFGIVLGALAGYYGGWVDDVIVWLYSTLACIPGLILLLSMKFALQGKVLFDGFWFELDMDGMAGLCIIMATASWIGTCRLVRAETLKLRELDYVLAARASGRGGLAILLRHIVPNLLHIGIINFSLGFIGAIKFEVFLSFLNLGIPDRPSWGRMINDAKMNLVAGRWSEIVAATTAMFIIVLAWNLFGDRLRDALDPRLKNV